MPNHRHNWRWPALTGLVLLAMFGTGAGCSGSPGGLVAIGRDWKTYQVVDADRPVTIALDTFQNNSSGPITLQSAELVHGPSDFQVQVLEVKIAQPDRSLDSGMFLDRPLAGEFGTLLDIEGARIEPGQFPKPYLLVFVVTIPADGKAQVDAARLTYSQDGHTHTLTFHNQTHLCSPALVEDMAFRDWCESDSLDPRPSVG